MAKTALEAFDKKVETIAGAAAAGGGGGRGAAGGGRGGGPPAAGPETLASAASALGGLVNSLGAADVPPTANQTAAITNARALATRVMAKWQALLNVDLMALNAALKTAGLPGIK